MKIHFENYLRQVCKEIYQYEREQRKKAVRLIKRNIKKHARAIKITGNLEKGVYHKHEKNASFVGIHAPGYQNYLLEFGHWSGKPGSPNRKWVPPHPIVYFVFDAFAGQAVRIMSEPMDV